MEKDVEEFYDNAAKNYSDHDNRMCDRIIEYFVMHYISHSTPSYILDAGGGRGRFSKPLLLQGHNILLTDLSGEMLKEAKKILGRNLSINFSNMSVTNMSEIIDNSVDVILMINAILDYCGDYNKAMSEAFRILKRGGLFIGTVNNRFLYSKKNELRNENYELFEKSMKTGDRNIVWGGQEKGHMSHEFTLHELRGALTQNNFIIKKILGIFNLLDKYEMEEIKDKESFFKLQIKYAEYTEYINNSTDFFFVAQKPK